jgi:hypothetical protein
MLTNAQRLVLVNSLSGGATLRAAATAAGTSMSCAQTFRVLVKRGTCRCGLTPDHAEPCVRNNRGDFRPADPVKTAAAIRLRVEEDLPSAVIAKQLKMTLAAVYKILKGRPRNAKRRCTDHLNVWSEEEFNIITRLYPSHPREEIMAALPERSWDTITLHASILGVRRLADANYTVPETVDPIFRELRRRRLDRGLTVQALVGLIPSIGLGRGRHGGGIHHQMITGCETGRRDCSLQQLRRWAAALTVNLDLADRQGPSVIVDPVDRKGPSPSVIINLPNHSLVVDGRPVHITPTWIMLLERLARRPGILVTKAQLHAALYAERLDGGAEEKVVDVYICKIRNKLGSHEGLIETVWGTGYIWRGLAPIGVLPPQVNYAPREEASSGVIQGALREVKAPAAPALARPVYRPPAAFQVATAARQTANPMRRSGGVTTTVSPPTVIRPSSAPPKPAASPMTPSRLAEAAAIEQFLAERGATRVPGAGDPALNDLPPLRYDYKKHRATRAPAEAST